MENYKKELEDIKKILLKNPRGLTISEISEKINVNRNAVAKYMDVLRTEGGVEKKEVGPSKIFYLSQRLPMSALINAYQDAILSVDKDLKVIKVNKAFNSIIPFSKNIFVGQKFTEEPLKILYSEIQPELEKALSGKEVKKDISFMKGEKEVCLHIKIIPSVFEDESAGATLLIKDVTDKVKTENDLKFEREQFLSIFESFNEVIYVSDPVTHEILYVNKFLKKMLNKDPTGSLCYKEFQNRIFPCSFCTNGIILKNRGESYQWEYHNPSLNKDFMITDKIIRWPDGRDVRLEIAIDITRIRNAERELKESEKELRKSHEIAGLGIWNLDIANNILSWSPGIYKLFGLDSDKFDATYETFLNSVHPSDRDIVNQAYTNSIKEKKPYDIIHRIVRPDGEILHVREVCETTYNEEGEPLTSTGIIQDVTKVKKFEEEIENLSRFPSENPYPVLRINKEGVVIYANDASKSFLTNSNLKVGEQVPESIRKFVFDAIKSKKIKERELGIKDRDFIFSFVPIPNRDYVNVYGYDITDFKK